MRYKPTASSQETIVAEAEFSPQSALRFMSLIEQKKDFEEKLQTKREDEFFDQGYASQVSIEDIETSNTNLTDLQLKDIESRNLGEWDTTIESGYSFGKYRENSEILDRITAVSEVINIPTSTNSIEFDTERVSVEMVNGEESIVINVTEEDKIRLYINSDNMEMYQGMYDPPVTLDIDSLDGRIDTFDRVVIRNMEDGMRRLLESEKPDTVTRELSGTEVLLRNEIDTRTYIPSEVMNENTSEDVWNKIDQMSDLSPLPDWRTEKFILKFINAGYMLSKQKLKLFDLILENRETALINYSYSLPPSFYEQLGRILGSECVGIPQAGWLLMSHKETPDWMDKLDEEFPEKNSLTEKEQERIAKFVDTPEFVDINSDWSEDVMSKEIILEMYEGSEIAQDRIVSYYLQPWSQVRPTRDAVQDAIDYGEKLRKKLKEADEEYGIDLYDSTIIYKQRKIYKRSNFELD